MSFRFNVVVLVVRCFMFMVVCWVGRWFIVKFMLSADDCDLLLYGLRLAVVGVYLVVVLGGSC